MKSKKIGIIGGLSPESTVSYYLHITHSYFKKFGTYHYPEIIIYSVCHADYHKWRDEGRWDLITEDLAKAANSLLKSGADFGLIATNTMHKVFNDVQEKTDLPLINLIDITAQEIKDKGLSKVGLLGTKFTMQEPFYIDGLKAHGIEAVTPTNDEQAIVFKIIMEELTRGILLDESKQQYLTIIDNLVSQGAQGVILGCTEIPLLIQQDACQIPVIDTATIHAEAALLKSIEN